MQIVVCAEIGEGKRGVPLFVSRGRRPFFRDAPASLAPGMVRQQGSAEVVLPAVGRAFPLQADLVMRAYCVAPFQTVPPLITQEEAVCPVWRKFVLGLKPVEIARLGNAVSGPGMQNCQRDTASAPATAD